MKGLIESIRQHLTTHAPFVAFFGGRVTHGTADKGTARPKLVYRVMTGGDAPERSTGKTQQERPRVSFFAECASDDDALTAVELLERELRQMPRQIGGGYLIDMTVQGKAIDEQPDQDNDASTVWEGSLLMEFWCGRDVR